MIDQGKYYSAIVIFNEAIKYDSVSVEYPYEKALACYYKNNMEMVAAILDSLLRHNKINEKIYTLLGNCYEAQNNDEKAIETYQEGLDKFRRSGRLYLEMGIIKHDMKEISAAIANWEKGVEVQPDFPNNYYFLSITFSENFYHIWSLLDGEIFILLSENKTRIKEISKLMYNVFNKSLFYKDEKGNASIKFTLKDIISDKPRPTKDLPFETACQAVFREKRPSFIGKDTNKINIEKIYKIREAFIRKWFDEGLRLAFRIDI